MDEVKLSLPTLAVNFVICVVVAVIAITEHQVLALLGLLAIRHHNTYIPVPVYGDISEQETEEQVSDYQQTKAGFTP